MLETENSKKADSLIGRCYSLHSYSDLCMTDCYPAVILRLPRSILLVWPFHYT